MGLLTDGCCYHLPSPPFATEGQREDIQGMEEVGEDSSWPIPSSQTPFPTIRYLRGIEGKAGAARVWSLISTIQNHRVPYDTRDIISLNLWPLCTGEELGLWSQTI